MIRGWDMTEGESGRAGRNASQRQRVYKARTQSTKIRQNEAKSMMVDVASFRRKSFRNTPPWWSWQLSPNYSKRTQMYMQRSEVEVDSGALNAWQTKSFRLLPRSYPSTFFLYQRPISDRRSSLECQAEKSSRGWEKPRNRETGKG